MDARKPEIRLTALNPNGEARDFEADILERLKKHGAKMHGCDVDAVECKIDGAVAVWFAGMRDGLFWRGALRLNFPLLRDKKWLGDPLAVSESVLQILHDIGLRENHAILGKAAAH